MGKAKMKNKEKKLERKKEAEESEEKIDETKEDSEEEPKIVEGFLKNMPLFGGFFKELGKTEVFKKRFEEVNKQIDENLRKGGKKAWDFQAHISTRPIIKEPIAKKEEPSEIISISKDCWYSKKIDKLALVTKAPSKDVEIILEDKNLKLKDKKWEKNIRLPDKYRTIVKKQYKEGVLILELTK